MTSDSRKPLDKEDLERDLEELRALLSDREAPEPPELLNQAVLNMARRELAADEKRLFRRFPMRWVGAFATASVIVLALGLIVQQEQESAGLPGVETGGVEFRSAAPREERSDAAELQSAPERIDRDVSALRRAAPEAAATAKTAQLATEERMEDPALPTPGEASGELRLPQDWIDLMLDLKASNQQARLSEELEAFRSAYPDYPLPAELSE